ncbi:MAG: lasso RiPP family leader peptide-containing protein [Pseudonocardiaceae bacterium]
MTERLKYEAPALVEIGSLHELTLTVLQKIGGQTDALTGNPALDPGGTLTGHISLLPN